MKKKEVEMKREIVSSGDFSTFVKVPKIKQMTMEDVDKRIDKIVKTSGKKSKSNS